LRCKRNPRISRSIRVKVGLEMTLASPGPQSWRTTLPGRRRPGPAKGATRGPDGPGGRRAPENGQQRSRYQSCASRRKLFRSVRFLVRRWPTPRPGRLEPRLFGPGPRAPGPAAHQFLRVQGQGPAQRPAAQGGHQGRLGPGQSAPSLQFLMIRATAAAQRLACGTGTRCGQKVASPGGEHNRCWGDGSSRFSAGRWPRRHFGRSRLGGLA